MPRSGVDNRRTDLEDSEESESEPDDSDLDEDMNVASPANHGRAQEGEKSVKPHKHKRAHKHA